MSCHTSKKQSGIKIVTDPTGAIVIPLGFKAGVAYCGLKSGHECLDIGIIYSELPCIAAAVFTNNKIVAASIKFSRNILKNGTASAVIVNSGNANACTGNEGYKDAETMAELTAGCLNIKPTEVLVASTGIIGHRLQMDKIRSGITSASQNMNNHLSSGANLAKAIMTTDLCVKESAVEVKTKEFSFTIGGIAKGSGMISPDLATMLSFITTDAKISRDYLNTCLKKSVNRSFNRITVDGHTSTNDMVAIMANGATESKELSSKSDIRLFQEALDCVTLDLAKKIVKDGEGASKFVQIDVSGAKTVKDAEKIARAIAESPLVKTAINGEDPNWGRIVSAAGYAGARLEEKCLNLFINEILIVKSGSPVSELSIEDVSFQEKLRDEMKKKEITLRLDIGLGSGKCTMWTCDFSHEYVTINAEYHT